MRRFMLIISLSVLVCGAALFVYARNVQRGEVKNEAVQPASSVVVQTRPDQSAPRPPSSSRPEPWTDENFLVRTSSALSAYNMSNGSKRYELPLGLLSADGKQYVALIGDMLTRFDPATGRATDKFRVEGRWQLSALSNAGEWIVFTRIPSEAEKLAWANAKTWHTDVRVYARNDPTPFRTLNLQGQFEVDAVSPQSGSLFLIEHRPPTNPDKYVVRLYDLAHERLQADPLREKGAQDEVMTGYAWNGVATPDGQYLLTLYLNTSKNVAFVHTLDLVNMYPVCIFLPAGTGDVNVLKQYTLSLAPNGRTVYASNAAMGIVAEISLRTTQVTHVEQFAANTYGVTPDYNVSAPSARSVLNTDGSKLYFTSGWDVWAYDTKERKVDGPFLVNAPISTLGVSGDGKRLYVAASQDSLLVFDATSGAPLSFPPVATSMSGQ